MALIQANLYSRSLKRIVTVHVILPVDKYTREGRFVREDKPFKTLYLLHGLSGNYTDWVSGTRIQRWAEEKNLAVIMPSGDNAYYLDQIAPGRNYGEFVGSELVEVTRRMFPLSNDREDTFIGGLSMGGFGAIRNGLKYHETFGYVAGLSSSLRLFDLDMPTNKELSLLLESYFGDFREAALTDKHPKVIVEALKKRIDSGECVRFPKIFMACGTEDNLLETNRICKDFFLENGLSVSYHEGPGGHDWDFWDESIRKVLDWLPLEGATE